MKPSYLLSEVEGCVIVSTDPYQGKYILPCHMLHVEWFPVIYGNSSMHASEQKATDIAVHGGRNNKKFAARKCPFVCPNCICSPSAQG